MSRAIPRAAKNEAFKLWLGGYSYREIRDKTGMSLGAINQLIDEARRASTDLNKLRELNIILGKGGSSVYDAIRGGRLLDIVNRLGMSLDQMDGYLKLAERFSSERGVDGEGFVNSALKLMRLEGETGKTYEEVIEDFEGKLSEATKLEGRKGNLKGEIRELGTERAKLEAELTETKKDLTQIVQELKRTISVKERLDKMGLEKLNALAEFIEDYEALGFSAQEVQRLAEWRKSLAEMEIDPDRLGEYIKEGGSLKSRLKAIEEKIKSGEARLKMLTKVEGDFRRRVDDIKRVDSLLQRRHQSFVCAYCGFATPHEVRRYEAQSSMDMAQPLYVRCGRCGATNTYDPRAILTNLGLEVLS